MSKELDLTQWKWNNKVALIFGINGQDGSYLSEFLLSKGYKVRGIIRRASSTNTSRIHHLDKFDDIYGKTPKSPFYLQFGDLGDATSIRTMIEEVQPNEIYNLGAQSHVGISFRNPESTINFNTLGALRILEAIKEMKLDCKYYQASSSEMFGISPPPQNEDTKMLPQSPYGIAKLAAYHLTRMYRNAYGLFACNGILFNHETVASFMPMFYKNKDEKEFDIKPICEIIKFDENKKHYQSKEVSEIQVWDKKGWTDVKFASAYPHNVKEDNKKPRFINSRSGVFMATADHIAFMENSKGKKVKDIKIGDKLETIELPESMAKKDTTLKEAELIGLMVGDGSITYEKKGIGLHGKFTNSSEKIRKRFEYLWKKVTKGDVVYYPSKSGFNPKKEVGQLRLNGGNEWLREIDLYNKDKTKKIPKRILNAKKDILVAFLRGYNLADSLKSNPCTYEFKNFKTNSATLAMGLCYLIDKATKQEINITIEVKDDGRLFYSINILSDVNNFLKEKEIKKLNSKEISQREISRRTGISRTFIRKIQKGGSCCKVHHLRKDSKEIKKIIEMSEYKGWFYDLETSSGTFHCGVGKCHVHNSPRRGLNFVTKKITVGISKILFREEKELVLGNLEAKRDWGFSKEYVQAMWKILQHNEPDDFVIATKETHSIREFLEEAFKLLDLNWEDFVKNNDRYRRPAEVPALLGDPSKAEKILYWEPKTKFKDLIKMMLAADIKYMMKGNGTLRKEDENREDDFFIEKGKELGRNLIREVKKEKVEKIFEDLDKLEGHFPKEVLDNIKQGLNKN